VSADSCGWRAARRPKLTPAQIRHARELYTELGADGKRKYTVGQIADLLGGVSGTTIYRALDRDDITARPLVGPSCG
jgi:hypothetical protein